MLLEILSMAMINPDLDKLAYVNPHVKTFEIVKDNYSEEFYIPYKTANFNKYYMNKKNSIVNVISDFNSRVNTTEQFLKWVNLPQEQLKGHLSEIYDQANALKGNTENPLVVIGIGGSKHTSELLLNLSKPDNSNVYFYSDIDPISYKSFIDSTKVGIQNLNFLVVTKSGTTFETLDAFKRFERDLTNYYISQGVRPKDARIKAQKHFAICTCTFAKEGNLRDMVNTNPYYIQNLYVHDGVGGRYSAFDDASLFTLAYAGVPQSYVEKMLKSAQSASVKYTDINNIENNIAMKNALFNFYAREKGFKILFQQYFGRPFEKGAENWAKQLYLESLKDFDFISSKAPDSMHYAAEVLYKKETRKNYYVVMTTLDTKISMNYKHYISAIKDTYADKNPVVVESLAVENGVITPEAIGEYVQTKHFETVFTGCLRRALTRHKKDIYIQYPEVVQYHVDLYKKKFDITKEQIKGATDVNKIRLKIDYDKYNVETGRND